MNPIYMIDRLSYSLYDKLFWHYKTVKWKLIKTFTRKGKKLSSLSKTKNFHFSGEDEGPILRKLWHMPDTSILLQERRKTERRNSQTGYSRCRGSDEEPKIPECSMNRSAMENRILRCQNFPKKKTESTTNNHFAIMKMQVRNHLPFWKIKQVRNRGSRNRKWKRGKGNSESTAELHQLYPQNNKSPNRGIDASCRIVYMQILTDAAGAGKPVKEIDCSHGKS